MSREMLNATDIVKNPGIVRSYYGKYAIIIDVAAANLRLQNLNRAICIMAENGWRAINITSHVQHVFGETIVMYALMERIGSASEGNEPVGDSEEVTDLSNRILCSDGTCTGVVDEKGVCKVCGKKYVPEDSGK